MRVFVFRGGERAESENKSCNISMEQVKEIGEMIGVSWALVDEERLKEVTNQEENKETGGRTGTTQTVLRFNSHCILFFMKIISLNVRGIGEV